MSTACKPCPVGGVRGPVPRSAVLLAITLILLALSGLTGCAHSDGFIWGARPDASFVKERGALYVNTPDGVEHIHLDGRSRRVVFPAMALLDVAPGGAMLAVRDGKGNLYLGEPSGAVTRIPELDGHSHLAAFSPDGRTVAATRFVDHDRTEEERKKKLNDTLFFIDVATRSVRVLPATVHGWPGGVAWSPDGATVWLSIGLSRDGSGGDQRIDVATGARRSAAGDVLPSGYRGAGNLRFQHFKCASTGTEVRWRGDLGDMGLELVEPNGDSRVLVRLIGRVRVHHGPGDASATLFHQVFTPTCQHVLFERNDGRLWIVETSSGAVGPLIPVMEGLSEDNIIFSDERSR